MNAKKAKALRRDARTYGDPLHLKAIKTLAKRRLLYGDQ